MLRSKDVASLYAKESHNVSLPVVYHTLYSYCRNRVHEIKIAKDLLSRVQLRWMPPVRGAETLDDVTQKSVVLGWPSKVYATM